VAPYVKIRPMIRARTTVGAKGRTIIPAAARRAAGIKEGQELMVLAEGRGRLRLATREALQAEVWAAAPAADEGPDAVTDVRAMRDEDNRLADAAAQRSSERGAIDQGETDAIGAELLRELGLDPGL
jgi:AbrB family looped-hinge helix DNA binding protein